MSNEEAMCLYRQSSAVSTAVDMIAQEIEQIQPVIRNKDGSLDDSHDIISLLKNPNDFNHAYQTFIGNYARDWLLTHNAYGYAAGTVSRPPLEIYNVRPQTVTSQTGTEDGFPNKFNVSQGPARGSYSRILKPKIGMRYYDGNMREIWQTSGYSSQVDEAQGDSPLLPICLEIYQQIKGRIHNVGLLENGARPSLLVTFQDEIVSQDELISRTQSIREQLTGPRNSGKVAVVQAGETDIKELGQTNKDMDFANLDQSARVTIFNRYHIPLPLISSDASTYNNMASSVEHLYDFAVIPNLDKIFSSLTMWLMPRYGIDPADMQITYNPEEIEALKPRRISNLQKRKEIGIESTNELRESMPNRDPLKGSQSNSVFVSATMVSIGNTQEAGPEMTPEEQAQALEDRDA
ncbi:MAG: phage portal protein [Gammaproteobacteria bacterium]|nr:phage portal protein [Gammaproteobacteria bacterium]